MQTDIFFNTTSQTGSDLKIAYAKALHQNYIIEMLFSKYPTHEFDAPEIEKILIESGYTILLTSIRRAINTLENQEKIIRTGKRIGKYKVNNFTYKLK